MSLKRISLFLLFFFVNLYSGDFGKTFFMPRTLLQDVVLQKVSSYNLIKNMDKSGGLKIVMTPFYKQSDNELDLAKYFLINGKTDLTIYGLDVVGIPDISSTWLTITNEAEEIIRDFTSKLKIRPEQKQFGFNLQIFKNLNYLNKHIMLSATAPISYVQTNLKFNEYDRSTNLDIMPLDTQNHSIAANATEAFNHPLLFSSKMKDGIQELAGIADIRLSIDLLLNINKFVDIDVYTFGEIPTGFKPKNEYLFEPIIGNGKHLGLGAGANFDLELYKLKNSKINLSAGLEFEYLFENNNERVFDLNTNGPFSRYLDIRRDAVDGVFQTSNLANITTLNSKVTPGFSFNSFIDLAYSYKKVSFKIGHNFWWRDSEKVILDEQIDSKYSITGLDIDGNGDFTVDSYFLNATIKDHASPSPQNDFNGIQNSDINLNSAAAPSAFTNKIYLNLSYDGKFQDNIYWIDFGIDYEFAGKNSALSNLGLLLQFGLSI